MKSYRELIEQTFEFPQKEFKVRDHELLFNDVPLMDIIKQYGTPSATIRVLPVRSRCSSTIDALIKALCGTVKLLE